MEGSTAAASQFPDFLAVSRDRMVIAIGIKIREPVDQPHAKALEATVILYIIVEKKLIPPQDLNESLWASRAAYYSVAKQRSRKAMLAQDARLHLLYVRGPEPSRQPEHRHTAGFDRTVVIAPSKP